MTHLPTLTIWLQCRAHQFAWRHLGLRSKEHLLLAQWLGALPTLPLRWAVLIYVCLTRHRPQENP